MLVSCPAYYSVSAPKAELLNKIKHMAEEMSEEEEQVDVNEKKVKNGDLCFVFPRKVVRVLAGLLSHALRQEGKGLSHHPSHPAVLALRTCMAL